MPLLDGWKYCPRCRAALELEEGKAACPACGLVAYASSSPTACGLVVDGEGRLLLARRAGGVFEGYWDLPGGFLGEGEHPLDALRRELREETGLEIEPDGFAGVYMDWYGEDGKAERVVATLNLYWTAHVVSGEERPDDDVSELRWFRPDELPGADELAFRNVAEVVSAWRQQDA
ncbi:MAG: NUDIX domain-containing protein [Gaiellaceae bacterium]